MTNACVIGHPVKHSRSPLIHNHWLAQMGIEGHYGREDVAPADLASFLGSLPSHGLAGCNITLPHKETACAHVRHLDDRARLTGSINTVYLKHGETYATSTDGEGFAENISWRLPRFSFAGQTVLILGAGGSSRAIVDELLRRGVRQILLANRTLEKAQTIARVFGNDVVALPLSDISQALPQAQLLVNTTSAGIANQDSLTVPFEKLRPGAVVTDINYVPLITAFLAQAASSGHTVVPGLGMLLHQAVTGFTHWFGRRPKVTEDLYTMVARDIDPGYEP